MFMQNEMSDEAIQSDEFDWITPKSEEEARALLRSVGLG